MKINLLIVFLLLSGLGDVYAECGCCGQHKKEQKMDEELMSQAPKLVMETEAGSVEVQLPWARATTAKNGACYVSLKTGTPDVLKSASVAPDLCERVELHNHIEEAGVMKMRRVKEMPLSSEKPLVMKPGGYHIMLIGLKRPLQVGERFPLKLIFQEAGEIEVTIPVSKRIPINKTMVAYVAPGDVDPAPEEGIHGNLSAEEMAHTPETVMNG